MRMLGPFTLVQGQQVCFCWRLERAGAVSSLPEAQLGAADGGAADAPASDAKGERLSRLGGGGSAQAREDAERESAEVIQYEMSASADAWRMAGPRRGQVRKRACASHCITSSDHSHFTMHGHSVPFL